MRYTGCLLIPLLILPNGTVRTQQRLAVRVGDRVRVTTDWEGAKVVAGTLVGEDSLGIHVQVVLSSPCCGQPSELGVVTVPRARIKQGEVRTGRAPNLAGGALIGFGTGVGLGLALGLVAASDPRFQVGSGDVARVVLVSGVVGAGIGGLVGLLGGSDHWEVARPAGVRVSLVPRPSSVVVAASVTF
jgi:hypothetical protein